MISDVLKELKGEAAKSRTDDMNDYAYAMELLDATNADWELTYEKIIANDVLIVVCNLEIDVVSRQGIGIATILDQEHVVLAEKTAFKSAAEKFGIGRNYGTYTATANKEPVETVKSISQKGNCPPVVETEMITMPTPQTPLAASTLVMDDKIIKLKEPELLPAFPPNYQTIASPATIKLLHETVDGTGQDADILSRDILGKDVFDLTEDEAVKMIAHVEALKGLKTEGVEMSKIEVKVEPPQKLTVDTKGLEPKLPDDSKAKGTSYPKEPSLMQQLKDRKAEEKPKATPEVDPFDDTPF